MNRATRAFVLALSVSAIASAVIAGMVLAKSGGVPAIPLNNEQETTGATGGGSGFFSYTIAGSELCYTLEVRDLTVSPVGAHIHPAPRNIAGPVAVPLLTPPAATSAVSACITAAEGGAMTPAELAAIAADPGAFYVNVHTPTYPGGEVRGQLK
ncbi:MAG TPA: CHRD domain-containing protein [Candidatus Polarisedimenticolia bacterium]|nr:CHRD domain-containing protein [Candidatus Polarisedimenticolia bacterium]